MASPDPTRPPVSHPTPAAVAAALAAPPLGRIYLKLTLVSLCWGGTFIAGRVLATAVPATMAAAGRFAIAAALLVLLAWKVEGGLPRLTRRQLVTTFVLGLTGIFLYNLSFLGALARMPAGRTALFVALNPVVTALLMAILFRERLSRQSWVGIFVAFCGAVVIISRGDVLGALRDVGSAFGAGEAMMTAAVVAWAAYTIVGRHALVGLSPLVATTYAALWGLALLLAAALLEHRAGAAALGGIGWTSLLAMAYLGAFGTVVAFVWYYQGVKLLGPARTTVFNNLVPVFGVLLATLLLGERITGSMVVGGALVVGGVALTNRGR